MRLPDLREAWRRWLEVPERLQMTTSVQDWRGRSGRPADEVMQRLPATRSTIWTAAGAFDFANGRRHQPSLAERALVDDIAGVDPVRQAIVVVWPNSWWHPVSPSVLRAWGLLPGWGGNREGGVTTRLGPMQLLALVEVLSARPDMRGRQIVLRLGPPGRAAGHAGREVAAAVRRLALAGRLGMSIVVDDTSGVDVSGGLVSGSRRQVWPMSPHEPAAGPAVERALATLSRLISEAPVLRHLAQELGARDLTVSAGPVGAAERRFADLLARYGNFVALASADPVLSRTNVGPDGYSGEEADWIVQFTGALQTARADLLTLMGSAGPTAQALATPLHAAQLLSSRVQERYLPSAAQVSTLAGLGLVPRFVPVDGDCFFAALSMAAPNAVARLIGVEDIVGLITDPTRRGTSVVKPLRKRLSRLFDADYKSGNEFYRELGVTQKLADRVSWVMSEVERFEDIWWLPPVAGQDNPAGLVPGALVPDIVARLLQSESVPVLSRDTRGDPVWVEQPLPSESQIDLRIINEDGSVTTTTPVGASSREIVYLIRGSSPVAHFHAAVRPEGQPAPADGARVTPASTLEQSRTALEGLQTESLWDITAEHDVSAELRLLSHQADATQDPRLAIMEEQVAHTAAMAELVTRFPVDDALAAADDDVERARVAAHFAVRVAALQLAHTSLRQAHASVVRMREETREEAQADVVAAHLAAVGVPPRYESSPPQYRDLTPQPEPSLVASAGVAPLAMPTSAGDATVRARYVVAYQAAMALAEDLRLPGEQVEELVDEMVRLAGAAHLEEHLGQVFGSAEVVAALIAIQEAVVEEDVTSRCGLVSLVNDLLMSVALVPTRHAHLNETVTPALLVDVLTGTAEYLAGGGFSPLNRPALAEVGYQNG